MSPGPAHKNVVEVVGVVCSSWLVSEESHNIVDVIVNLDKFLTASIEAILKSIKL